MKVEIRYSIAEDESYLHSWMQEESIWFPMENAKEIDFGVKNWIGFAKYKCSLTVMEDKEPCAIGTLFLMPYRKMIHQSMFYMIVDKAHRRKGIGTLLLKNLEHLAGHYFKIQDLYCEIYEGCRLQPILERAGYELFARQEHYVKLAADQYLSRILYIRSTEAVL